MESFGSLGLDEIERLQKRGIRFNESYGASLRTNEGDVLNIGSGTRCKSCGMLYFCWVDKCRTCGGHVDFNLSTKE